MNKTEKKYFEQIKNSCVELGVYSPADDFTIIQAAQLLWQIDKARRALNKEGQIIEYKSKARAISPEVNIWRGLRQDWIKYATQLGLTPRARKAIAAFKEVKEVKDPLTALRKII